MPWGKMDDKFHRHEKVRALRREKAGREALGVWVYWWSWCLDDAALDGAVPLDVFPEADMKGAALLVKHGLWHQEAECFRFHNFNKWNPTPEQRAHKKENDRTKIAAKRAALDVDVACDIAATLPDVACDSLSTSANVARESPPRARALGSPSPSPSPSLPNPQPLVSIAPLALVVDESLRFPEPGAVNFNTRDLERAVLDVRGTEWRIPSARHHQRQAAETAAHIMSFAAAQNLNPCEVARRAFAGWLASQKSVDPMVWCANWASALPAPPPPERPRVVL